MRCYAALHHWRFNRFPSLYLPRILPVADGTHAPPGHDRRQHQCHPKAHLNPLFDLRNVHPQAPSAAHVDTVPFPSSDCARSSQFRYEHECGVIRPPHPQSDDFTRCAHMVRRRGSSSSSVVHTFHFSLLQQPRSIVVSRFRRSVEICLNDGGGGDPTEQRKPI